MPCETCGQDAVCCSSLWQNDDAMIVLYWCKQHAPEDTEYFDAFCPTRAEMIELKQYALELDRMLQGK
jgi:hypothetical protein